MFADDKNLFYKSNIVNSFALNDEFIQIASKFAENLLSLSSSNKQLTNFSGINLDIILKTVENYLNLNVYNA